MGAIGRIASELAARRLLLAMLPVAGCLGPVSSAHDAALDDGALPLDAAPGDADAIDGASLPTDALAPDGAPTPALHLYGVLEPSSADLAGDFAAGTRLRELVLGWDAYEPSEGVFSATYLQAKKSEYQAMINAGYQVVLDFGAQYPPSWIFNYANSHYIDQYGDVFPGGMNGNGMNGVNAVFNQTMRDKLATYYGRVLADLGTNFFAIRLGGGWYDELNYPPDKFNGHINCYWAFDPIAQGQSAGLPPGATAAPLPGWTPGTTSVNHVDASAFADWYMNSLKGYHDWQIATVRGAFAGRLFMLYPSWGIRPGQLAAAVDVDLDGTTSPEINGEVPRGFDFARYVAGISDGNVVVYSTWLDASDAGDGGIDPTQWSPIHYLSSLAAANPLHPATFGENTGQNSFSDMQRCFLQTQLYGLGGMMWAFESDLYGGQYASIAEYAGLIPQYP